MPRVLRGARRLGEVAALAGQVEALEGESVGSRHTIACVGLADDREDVA